MCECGRSRNLNERPIQGMYGRIFPKGEAPNAWCTPDNPDGGGVTHTSVPSADPSRHRDIADLHRLIQAYRAENP